MSHPFQHAAALRLQGEHVSRTAEIGRFGVFLHRFHGGHRAFEGGDARRGRDVVNGNGECGAVVVRIVRHHLLESQFVRQFAAHGHADEPFGVGCHEIDVFQRGELRGANQVAFVLAVGVVRHDDDFPGAQVGDGFFDGIEFEIFHE